jgi:hypothetical protein
MMIDKRILIRNVRIIPLFFDLISNNIRQIENEILTH